MRPLHVVVRFLALVVVATGLGFVVAPSASTAGPNAVQPLDYCTANALPANDDDSTEAIPIPFQLSYFGAPFTELYVNNNGNVTFGSSLSEFTPSDLTGTTERPIIAPFFADVDTTGAGSAVVTYGASPDGKTFCVNWVDVGYFASHTDKLNSVQLLLRANPDGPGRTAGDFDITFNYDRIVWETGDASGGTDGFGGTSAAAGFSNGSGEPGTFVQLPGSLVNGALLDGGPNALIGGSQGSSQLGRYVFEVRNDGAVALGSLSGTVVTESDAPVADAYVQACRGATGACSYTYTDDTGAYSFSALFAGAYDIVVWPPDDSLFGGGGSATVTSGAATVADPIVLGGPTPLPGNVSITSIGNVGGVPIVYYQDDLDLVVTGCAGVTNPSYTVRINGQVVRNEVPMDEIPAGTYRATIPAFYPQSGDAEVRTNIPATCGGDPTVFDLYIDPSGIVTDQYGRPLAGATVTLLRSDTVDGSYTEVPDGSAIMSPSNRDNPSITDSIGFFHWDVTAGYYQVRAEASGCTPATTPAMQVPPERIDLLIKMPCTAAAPVPLTQPSVTGTARVGETLTAVPATWPAPLAGDVQLLRNGSPLPSASYVVTAADVGATFAARSTGRRPPYVQEGGTGDTVTFEGVTVTSPGVVATAAPAPTLVTGPVITGVAKVGQTLQVSDPVWSPASASTRQWLNNGTPIPGATGSSYVPTAGDVGDQISVRATSSAPGTETATATSNSMVVAAADTPPALLVSTTTAKFKDKVVPHGQRAKLVVKVKAAGVVPTGKVQVRKGSKVVAKGTLSAGKVTIKLPKLKKGTYKFTAVYLGDSKVAGSKSGVVRLRVT